MSRIWIRYLSPKPSPDLLAGHATLCLPVLRRYAFSEQNFFLYFKFSLFKFKEYYPDP